MSASALAVKIVLAAVLGAVVGAEREYSGQWAGLRTHMLISLGAALFTTLSLNLALPFPALAHTSWDPSRIAAAIVAGIGFLGAGTILKSHGTVHGLTTAAGLWVAAAIGMAVGAESYVLAIAGAFATLLILAGVKPLEKLLFGRRQALDLDLAEGRSPADLVRILNEIDVHEILEIERDNDVPSRVRVLFAGTAEQRRELVRRASRAGVIAGRH